MEQALQRDYFRLLDDYVFDEWSVHHSGCALMLHNESDTLASVVSIQDSDDGATWSPLTFSTPSSAANLQITMQPKSQATILFQTVRRYLRISLGANNPTGVFVHKVQWMPINPQFAGEYV